jgi:hypothetical protein
MSHPSLTNIGAYIKGVLGVTAFNTAGGTGDNTEAIGAGIDRTQSEGGATFGGGNASFTNPGTSLAQSCTVIICASATLAASKTQTIKLQIYEDSAVGGGTKTLIAAALQPGGAANTVVLTLTDPGAGSTQTGVVEFDLNMESLKRYIFVSITPHLNAANTDTGFTTAAVVLGGFRHLPM